MGEYLLVGLAGALAWGAALAGLAGPFPWGLPTAGPLLGLALLRKSTPALWAAALLVGLALTGPPSLPPEELTRLPCLSQLTGRVQGPIEPHRASVSFFLAPEGWRSRVLVYLRLPEGELLPGAEVTLVGEGEVPQSLGWREYLVRREVVGVFWAREVEVLGKPGPALGALMGKWRGRLLYSLRELLPGPGGELLAALLIGARGLLPAEREAAFRRAGVAHLLALSGLHLGILVGAVWWGLGLVRLGKGARYFVLLPLTWLYVGLAGARVSLIRAAIMLSFLGAYWVLVERGWVLRRWYRPLGALAGAALVVVLVWPWSPLDPGFQLSFSATGAILVLWPAWSRTSWRRWLTEGQPISRPRRFFLRLVRWAADLVAVSAFAQLGSLPIVGSTFGYFSPWGLFANLVLIPWTAVLLVSGLVLLACSPLPCAPALGRMVEGACVQPYLGVVDWLACLPGAELSVGAGFGMWCLGCWLGLLLLRELPAAQSPLGYSTLDALFGKSTNAWGEGRGKHSTTSAPR